MFRCNKWRLNKYKCTEAKHLVNPTCSAESAKYCIGSSSKAYLYHKVIGDICSCGVNNSFISYIKKTLLPKKRERERERLLIHWLTDKNN